MFTKRLLSVVIGAFICLTSFAQVKETVADVDVHSLGLYTGMQWKTLLIYGKEEIAAGIDFPLLRMRTGYAAFMLQNYGQSLVQYKKVLDDDPTNSIALYYVYLNNLYLNNSAAARFYAGKLPAITRAAEKITNYTLSGVNGEFSYKISNDTSRRDVRYARIGVGLQPGYRFELEQSVAFFSQNLSEPLLINVTKNRNINNNQKEYYAKLSFAASGTVALLGGYHYIYTPFNNLVYNNNLVFAGIRYTSPFVHLKAMAAFGNVTDATYRQYDFTVSVFPMGNTRLYSISRAAFGDALTFSQVAGYRIIKNLWLEANITLGHYNNLLENDGLYVYNDIDKKQFKAGAGMYMIFSKKGLLSFNYSFDRKLKYGTFNNYFNQHSLNTAISWKF